MIKLAKLIKEIMDVPPTNNIQQASNAILSNDFINYIKSVENAQKEGYDKTNHLWFPTKSVEGGFPTIGYGHKIQTNHELDAYKKGISDSAVESLLKSDLSIANKHVHEYINHRYKVDLMLNPRQNEMLTDFAFNLGSLKKFPKFVDAVLKNDKSVQQKEYKRYSGGKELKQRNVTFYNRYLK